MAWHLVRRALARFSHRPDFAWVTPEIAVGGQFTAAQAAELVAIGINSIVDMRAEAKPDVGLLDSYGLRVLHVPVPDGHAPTEEQFWKAVAWVESEIAQERSVLVHCRAGMGRSVLVVCAVLMAQGATPREAFQRVKERRPVAALNERQWLAARRFWQSQGVPSREGERI